MFYNKAGYFNSDAGKSESNSVFLSKKLNSVLSCEALSATVTVRVSQGCSLAVYEEPELKLNQKYV